MQVNKLTLLRRKNSNNTAELALPQAVVHAHLHFKQGQGCDAVVSANISGCIGRCQNRLGPGAAAEWAESHHIAKVLSALLLLWNWLR